MSHGHMGRTGGPSTPHRGQYIGGCGKDKGCKKGWHVGGKGGKTEDDAHISLSRKLTWILRHGPAVAHVKIDNQGWVDVAQLLQSPVMRAFKPSVHMIRHIVVTCKKQRFELKDSNDGKVLIRATQGHSIEQVDDSAHTPITGPGDLGGKQEVVHGTCLGAWMKIRQGGLNTMGRNHIHFCTGLPGSGANSANSTMRKSADVAIFVDVASAITAGIEFLQSSNGVVLTKGEQGDWRHLPHTLIHPSRMARQSSGTSIRQAEWRPH